MRAKLQGLESNQAKLDWLREQIEMRVVGLGFDEYKPAWSSSKDEFIGTVDDLSEQLREILLEEEQRRGDGELPQAGGRAADAAEDVQGTRHTDGAGAGAR